MKLQFAVGVSRAAGCVPAVEASRRQHPAHVVAIDARTADKVWDNFGWRKPCQRSLVAPMAITPSRPRPRRGIDIIRYWRGEFRQVRARPVRHPRRALAR